MRELAEVSLYTYNGKTLSHGVLAAGGSVTVMSCICLAEASGGSIWQERHTPAEIKATFDISRCRRSTGHTVTIVNIAGCH